MKSLLNLKPGQKGTKKLMEIYGKSLLYVRYRYDEEQGVRLKTVGLIIEKKPWQPLYEFGMRRLSPSMYIFPRWTYGRS
jgi:serine kinase of HPr protein (carbohydrate metabolism regulator)